jgi:hypothetical protein
MNATRSSPTIDGVFDAFLFAPVGDETNGMALSVLSALARLDIDPWADAARLSRLPKDSAIVALGQSIARLPLGKWQPADITAIATRLVELLPKPDGATPKAVLVFAKTADWKRRTILVLSLLSVGLGVYLLVGGFSDVEHRSAGIPIETGRTHAP